MAHKNLPQEAVIHNMKSHLTKEFYLSVGPTRTLGSNLKTFHVLPRWGRDHTEVKVESDNGEGKVCVCVCVGGGGLKERERKCEEGGEGRGEA